MKIFSILLASVLFASITYSQLVTVDTLFVQGQLHHAEGMRLLSEGNKKKALEELHIATDKLRDVQDGLQLKSDSLIHFSEQLLKNYPQSPVYNYLLGRALQQSKSNSSDSARSTYYLNKALEIEPGYAWPYLALAYPYREKKDYITAIQYYHKAIAIDSAFDFIYDTLIKTYEEQGDTSHARRIENLLMTKYPRSFTANLRRGQNAWKERNVDTKIKLYRDIIAFGSDDALKASGYWGLLWAFNENQIDSLDVLARQVLQLGGINYQHPKQYAYLKLFQRAKKKGTSAVNAITEEVLQTTDSYANSFIGKYYFDSLKQYEQALKCYQRAYEVSTKEFAYNTLAFGLFTDHALEEVANNNRAFNSYYLGLTYLILGQNENAKEYFIRAALGRDSNKIADAYFQLGLLFTKEYLAQAALGNKSEKPKPLFTKLNPKEHAIKWFSNGLALQENEEARKQLVGLVGSEEKVKQMVEELRKTKERNSPDFKLYSLDGDSVELSSFRGKIVLLDFWATWCRPCVIEMPHLQKVIDRYAKSTEVKFLSISMDRSRDSVKPFIEKNKYAMKILYGDDETSLDYGAQAIPSLFLIDREGKIQYKHVGFDGDGEKFIKMVSGEIEGLLSESARLK